MIVLGIDSSTDKLGIGLADENRIIVERTLEAAQEHAARIMDLIEAVLAEALISKEILEGIAVAGGPGSFTGLRIGMAAAKGMALALDIPIVGISTFEVVGRRLLPEYPEFYLAALLRKGEMYLCRVDINTSIREAIFNVDEKEVLSKSGSLPLGVIGRQPEGWIDTVRNLIPSEKTAISGGELAGYGARMIASGETADVATLEPLYIVSSQAERKFGRG